MLIQVEYIKSEETLQRSGNQFFTQEEIDKILGA